MFLSYANNCSLHAVQMDFMKLISFTRNSKLEFSYRDLVSISKEVGDGSRARISDAICTIWDQCSNENEIFYSSMIMHDCVI